MSPKRSRLESILLPARGTGTPGTLPFFASFWAKGSRGGNGGTGLGTLPFGDFAAHGLL